MTEKANLSDSDSCSRLAKLWFAITGENPLGLTDSIVIKHERRKPPERAGGRL